MNFVLLLCLATCACAASSGQQTYSLENAEVLFEKFIVDYNKQYADEHEKQMRFEIFKQSLIKINASNEKQGGIKVFGINEFSDYTSEEHQQLKGLSGDKVLCPTVKTNADIPDAGAPDSWDWRDQNVVTKVKLQLCESCYAYSSTGNIEGQYAIKTKQLVSLSEQQIIDCAQGIDGNNGCWGGVMSGVFLYLQDHGGIESQSDYPPNANGSDCMFDSSKVAVKVTNCTSYDLTSQDKLKQLLYKNGPLAVALDADDVFPYEQYVIKNCSHNGLNHGVLLVGYGTDPVGGDFWLLKNSWGQDWGDYGYFRIERGEGLPSCGLLNNFMASAIVA